MNLLKNIVAGITMLACMGANATNVTMSTPANFEVLSVSPNGHWACGVYVDAASTTTGFRWNLLSGELQLLSTDESVAWDVANDGTVSGEFLDTEVLANHSPILMVGYWRDGAWHHIEMPEGKITDGIGNGISADGQYITGSVCLNGIYTPYIWKNGAIHRCLDTGKHAVSMAVAPDGNAAAGFNTTTNRTACYWAPDGQLVHFTDSPDYSASPWNYARNFSPDGSKLLYWGGWEYDEGTESLYLYSVYDIATGERIKLKAQSIDSTLEYFDIANDGTLVGLEAGRGYICSDGQGMFIDQYLESRGVDLSQNPDFYNGSDYYQGQLPIHKVTSLSQDASVMGMQYYNGEGLTSSLVVKFDQDFSQVAPVCVNAKQLAGLHTVALSWHRPVGANNIRGYNIYRDGVKINGLVPVNALNYYDKNLSEGVYNYEVSAITTAGVETRAEAVQLTVSGDIVEAPTSLFARQRGVNSAYLEWNAALSNLAHKRYFNIDGDFRSDFAVYDEITIEAAMRYSKSELACYSGYEITEVSFVPMAAHNDWKVNFYSLNGDEMQLIASQDITQALDYRKLNVVRLEEPIALPNTDLIVAIQLTVDPSYNSTIGTENGNVVAGYSDLLRQVDQPEFFSAYEASIEGGMYVSCISWAIDMGLAKVGASAAAFDHYVVTIGDDEYETAECSLIVDAIADGTHTATVSSVMADGSASKPIAIDFDITARYPAVDAASVDGYSPATISWQAPVDNDRTDITYSYAEVPAVGIQGSADSDYSMYIGSAYPAQKMRGYDGYAVKGFRFYPMAEAWYAIALSQNGQELLYFDLNKDDIVLNQWNYVECPEEIVINGDSEYLLLFDIFQATPEVGVFGMDGNLPYSGYSDLYSTNGGESWISLSEETTIQGNWMMGLVIEDADGDIIPVDGYDISIDGKKANKSTVRDTSFEYDFGLLDTQKHSVRIDAYYPGVTESVEGQTTYFTLSASSLGSIEAATITLHKGDNVLVAQGEGIVSLTLHNAAGTLVGTSACNEIAIGHLPSGTYIVTVTTATSAINKKIIIK